MEIYKKDETNKWTNDNGVRLSCGNQVNYKYNGEVVSGTVQYSDMWNGGYYLVLDNDQGSLPMFGNEIEVELK